MTKAHNENQVINSKLVTVEEAADRFGVKESYIKRMCREQKIEAFKVGKFWRMTESSLGDFINDLTVNREKTELRQDIQDKLRFHSMIRSLEAAPKSIERLNDTIDQVKETFQKEDKIKRIVLASKLKNLVGDRETKKQMVKEIPNALDEMAEVAYPGMKEVINEDADTLEWYFLGEINDKKGPEAEEEKKGSVLSMKTAGINR